MPILQQYIHKEGSSQRLINYIYKQGRSLGVDVSEEVAFAVRHQVATMDKMGLYFDEHRRTFGKDSGRKSYHFIISPDPELNEEMGLIELQSVAKEWAAKYFPDSLWVIGYHNDSDSGILHAHIALNSVDFNGKKIHFSDREFEARTDDLKEIAAHYGIKSNLQSVGHGREERTKPQKPKHTTMAEKKLASNQKWSWKQDISDAIDRNVPKAKTIDELKALLAVEGFVLAFNKRGGLTFTHPKNNGENHQYKVKDTKLGAAYSIDALEDRMATDVASALRFKMPEHLRGVRKYYKMAPKDFEFKKSKMRTPRTYGEQMAYRMYVSDKYSLQEVYDAVSELRQTPFRSVDDIDARIGYLDELVGKLSVDFEDRSSLWRAAKDTYNKAVLCRDYNTAYAVALAQDKAALDEFWLNTTEASAWVEAQDWFERKGLTPNEAITVANEILEDPQYSKEELSNLSRELGEIRREIEQLEAMRDVMNIHLTPQGMNKVDIDSGKIDPLQWKEEYLATHKSNKRQYQKRQLRTRVNAGTAKKIVSTLPSELPASKVPSYRERALRADAHLHSQRKRAEHNRQEHLKQLEAAGPRVTYQRIPEAREQSVEHNQGVSRRRGRNKGR